MNIVVRRIVIPFSVIVLVWMTVILVVSASVEALFGIGVSERLTPFSNVHLMEEASEGVYDPLTDWLFLAFRLVVALASFGVGGAVAAAGASGKQLRLAAISPALAVLLLVTLLGYVFGENYPYVMRMAAIADFLMCVGGAAVGFAVGRRLRWPRSVADG